MTTDQTIDEFRTAARAWLDANAERIDSEATTFEWGVGDLPVEFFPERSDKEERAHMAAIAAWEQTFRKSMSWLLVLSRKQKPR